MPVNVIEAKRRKRSTRKTGKSSDGSDDTPRPRKRLIGPEPKPEGDTDGSGRKPVSSKKKKKTPVKPKTPISAKKEGDRKVALDSKRKGTPKGTATGKVFGFGKSSHYNHLMPRGRIFADLTCEANPALDLTSGGFLW
jgi:hypothetical protein